jgi:hypothetical protein
VTKSNAGTILVLGICSIVVCGLLGPVAWSMGKEELGRIDRGELPATERSMVQAGYVCGIVGTCFVALAAVVLLFMMISVR